MTSTITTTAFLATVTPFVLPTITHEYAAVAPAYRLLGLNLPALTAGLGMLAGLGIWKVIISRVAGVGE